MNTIAPAPGINPLAQWVPSPNFNVRNGDIAFVVLHHTACHTAAQALSTLSSHNDGGRVSTHYLIGRDGQLFQLVAEAHRAWHAGVGHWAGHGDLNSISIGIELDNDGNEPFSDALVDTLVVLLEDIVARLRIPRRNIIGHADLAPARKVDPSVVFPWARLAQHGLGLWPVAPVLPAPAGFDPDQALRDIGYDLANRPAAIAAFHRHFAGHTATELSAADLDLLHNLQSQAKDPA